MAKLMDEEREYYLFVKKVFDKLAPFYNIFNFPYSRLRKTVVDFTAAEKGSRILDVATGTGKQAFAFAERGYEVTGVDFSEGMLGVAKRKNRYTNAKFQVADAASLPFDDNGFDVVSICFALHTMPPAIRKKVLSEMVRVTRQKGTIVICDFALPLTKKGKYLVYEPMKAPMGKYFVEFTHSDLEGLLKASDIELTGERRAVFTAVRILKGTKVSGK